MVDKEKIKEVLDKVRVSLQADGGDAELVFVEETFEIVGVFEIGRITNFEAVGAFHS